MQIILLHLPLRNCASCMKAMSFKIHRRTASILGGQIFNASLKKQKLSQFFTEISEVCKQGVLGMGRGRMW